MSTTVALIGLSGVGKTTVGQIVARRIGAHFVDSDDVIERAVGLPIAQIFDQLSESYFRVVEADMIRSEILKARRSPTVLALGAGAIGDDHTRRLLREHTRCVWMVAPLPLLAERVVGDQATERPLFQWSFEDPSTRLKEMLEDRGPLYAATSHTTLLAVDNPETVARRLIGLLDLKVAT